MNNGKLFSVSQFTITFLKRLGSILEEKGYALWEVLLPEELISHFGRDHFLLAFDYEIAEENPGSVFVTAGSSFLDTVIRLAVNFGKYTTHYWPKSNVVLSKNIESKINQSVTFQRCRSPVVTLHWQSENVYYGFYFRVAFVAYEKTEEIIPVVINGWNGFPVAGFDEAIKNVLMSDEPVSRFTDIPLLPIEDLHRKAKEEVEVIARKRAVDVQNSANKLLEKELDKTNRYYLSLIEEKQVKVRKSKDTKKTDRLNKQLEATKIEHQRRKKDISARYHVQVEVTLDHLLAWHIPCEMIRLEIKHKNTKIKETLIYNPVSGEVESPVCSKCGHPSFVLEPNKSAKLCCPACLIS